MSAMRPRTIPADSVPREERLGLGIAAAAHVALLLAMVLIDRSPPEVVIPERIVVTVSDEIALESVSPNPAADPAPSVAEEIGEITPPVEFAEAVPSPVATEAPRTAPERTRRETPAPAKKVEAPSRASRIGNDFLGGSGGSGSDTEQPASRVGPLTAASLASAISRQLRPHWTAPQGADAEKLVTVLSWEMNRDGSLRGTPRVVSQAGVTDANSAQKGRHAELAIRAVQLAAPFDLPDEHYDTWRRVSDFRFDRRL